MKCENCGGLGVYFQGRQVKDCIPCIEKIKKTIPSLTQRNLDAKKAAFKRRELEMNIAKNLRAKK